jgi:hypothetical protein
MSAQLRASTADDPIPAIPAALLHSSMTRNAHRAQDGERAAIQRFAWGGFWASVLTAAGAIAVYLFQ